MRTAELALIDETDEERTHRPRRKEVVAALGRTEARQIDGEQAKPPAEQDPDRSERVDAFGPRTGEHDGPVRRAVTFGAADPYAVDCAVPDAHRLRGRLG
jgi:hypothetical protein